MHLMKRCFEAFIFILKLLSLIRPDVFNSNTINILQKPMAIKRENPPTLRYKFLSAITNPTVKNMFEAGRYGKTNNDKAKVGRIADDESFLW